MNNIPFLDESYVQWQILSCDKIADKNISVVKAALNYDINPHLLYSGEYVARRINHTGYISYGHYINKFRSIDPHPLVSIHYLRNFGFNPDHEDIYTCLLKRRELFYCLSPVFSSLFLECYSEANQENKELLPNSIQIYLKTGHLSNFSDKFTSGLLLPPTENSSPTISLPCDDKLPNRMQKYCTELTNKRITIFVPTYNTSEKYIKELINSVLMQTYENWNLVIYDDGSSNSSHLRFCRNIARENKKIRLIESRKNRGISLASNMGLKYCKGDYILFLDHDDILHPNCLFELILKLVKEGGDIAYADHHLVDDNLRVIKKFQKGPWDLAFFLQVMYVCHPLVISKKLLDQVSGFDVTYNGIQDYEILIRLIELGPKVVYCSEALYYWRAAPTSFASSSTAKGCIKNKQVNAVQNFLERQNLASSLRALPNKNLPHRLYLEYSGSGLNKSIFNYNKGDHKSQLLAILSENINLFWIDSDTVGFLPQNIEKHIHMIQDLYKWFVLPDVCFTSIAQISKNNKIIAHGYTIKNGKLFPLCIGNTHGLDDGTGISVSDKSVLIGNRNYFALKVKELHAFECFLMSKVSLNEINLDSFVFLYSLFLQSISKKTISVMTPNNNEISIGKSRLVVPRILLSLQQSLFS